VADLKFRPATSADVAAVVGLLADDPLGAIREVPDDLATYQAAFARVQADPNQLLAVAVGPSGVVGTLQLTFIPGLSRHGATRAVIEAVRVSCSERGEGSGTALMAWAIDECRRRGCDLVQLTSDVSRTDAHRFYQRLGFVPSHVGFKLQL
jgi:GNAT superfamily N-acetyltransferase